MHLNTKFKNFIEHITHASAEASPVGEDDKRQLFALVEVLDGLSGFISAVGEPYSSGLLHHVFLRVEICRIGWSNFFDGPCLCSNYTREETKEDVTPRYRRPMIVTYPTGIPPNRALPTTTVFAQPERVSIQESLSKNPENH